MVVSFVHFLLLCSITIEFLHSGEASPLVQVSLSGTDSPGPGPFRTIQYALNQGAQNISVAAGTYDCAQAFSYFNDSSIRIVGENRPTITCVSAATMFSSIKTNGQFTISGFSINWGGSGVVWAQGNSYVVFDDIWLDGPSSNPPSSVLTAFGNSQFWASNCIFRHLGNVISLFSQQQTTISNCLFEFNSNLQIINNFASSQISLTSSIFQYNNGTIVASQYNVISTNNTFAHNTAAGPNTAPCFMVTGTVFVSVGNRFIGNAGDQGGCIRLGGGIMVTVVGSTFVSNTARSGGAIYADVLPLTSASFPIFIESSNFTSNRAVDAGGAVQLLRTALISDCYFFNNTATTAGAINIFVESENVLSSIELQYPSFQNCQFIQNNALEYGGAAAVDAPVYFSIVSCLFDRNAVVSIGICQDSGSGGAVALKNVQAYISNAVFKGNSAANAGGAVSSSTYISTQMTTFEGNTAQVEGGAVYCISNYYTMNSTIFLSNSATSGGGLSGYCIIQATTSSFTANEADSFGGGVALSSPSALVSQFFDCLFKANRAPSGGGLFVHRDTQVEFTNTTFNGNTNRNSAFLEQKGGGMLFADLATGSFSSCVFVNNSNVFGGAVALISKASLVFDQCLFLTNIGWVQGGAVNSQSFGDPIVISNSLFRGNGATFGSDFSLGVSSGSMKYSAVISRSMIIESADSAASLLQNPLASINIAANSTLTLDATMIASSNLRMNAVNLFGGNLILSDDALCTKNNTQIICSPGTISGFQSPPLRNPPTDGCQSTKLVSSQFHTSQIHEHVGCVCGDDDQLYLFLVDNQTVGIHAEVVGRLGTDISTWQISLSKPYSSEPTDVSNPTWELSQSARTPLIFRWSLPEQDMYHLISIKTGNDAHGCYTLSVSPIPATAEPSSCIFDFFGGGGVGGLWVISGQTYNFLITMRTQFHDPIVVRWSQVVITDESGETSSVSCPAAIGTQASTFVCLFQANRGGKHVISMAIGDSQAAALATITVVPLWVIAFCVIIGGMLIAIPAFIASGRWWRRRKRLEVDKMLENYVGLDSRKSQEPGKAAAEKSPLIERNLIIPFEEIEILRDVAAGATGKVMLGKWRRTKVAVKKYFGMSNMEIDDFVKECAVHHGLRHENIVQLLGVCNNPICVITEWMGRGSLFSIIQDEQTKLEWLLRLQFCTEIARGMHYLHSSGLLHRDLKSLNVFVNEDWRAKVGDFGQATCEKTTHTAMKGTLLWSAPEVFDAAGHYTQSADIYSFGIVMWELWTRRLPFSCNKDCPSGWQLMDYIKKGGRPMLPAEMTVSPPTWYSDLYQRSWQVDRSSRGTFEDYLVVLEREFEALQQRVVASGRPASYSASVQRSAFSVEMTSEFASLPANT